VFFDTLGIKWWYEPEGFSLRFDYQEFAASWDMDEEGLLEMEVPQTFAHLDGKVYSYLPDFYLPELHAWVEIKGPNPTREEIEKAFMLDHMVRDATMARMDEAKTEREAEAAFDDFFRMGVYLIYGDVPWPFPEKGNIFGYGGRDSGSNLFASLTELDSVAIKQEYRGLLMGELNLCWKECPLCLKIGVGKIGVPYCSNCHDQTAKHIRAHLAGYPVIGEAGTQDTSDQVMRDVEVRFGIKAPNPADVKAMQLTRDLMNPEFFTSGHKSPRLQEAYSAARSARFEHGESP
jgi:hypothetical protein